MRKRRWELWVVAAVILQAITFVTMVVMDLTALDRVKDIERVTVMYTEATESLFLGKREASVQEDPHPLYSQEEVALVAKTIYGEARGCSEAEKRLVAWCILNRVDDGTWGDTVEEVVTYPMAFHGYNKEWKPDENCVKVAQEVLSEWGSGKEADILEPYATTSEYLYFSGDGQHNWFREEY